MSPRTTFARALLAFLALPGLVAFAVPWLMVRGVPFVSRSQADQELPASSFHPLGWVLLGAGTVLLLWCVRDFYVAGRGTLAPWDPPRSLVVRGPYRWSRNPMYVAVSVILIGWAVGSGSGTLLLYALVVMAAFHLRVKLNEEPYLARTHRVEWERYRRLVPRWLFPSRRSLVATAAALLVALPLTGLVFEAYQDGKTRREFPPPGMLVDVDGHRLHLVCIGEGSPIVLFEASGFGVSSMQSATVRERVAARTRVCSYDRIGMGWSDPAPSAVTEGGLARDLAVLQDRAGLPAPFVIVSSSIGGLTAEMFARQYPERVAGLIFLDAANSRMLQNLQQYSGLRPAAVVIAAASQLGAVRLLDPFELDGDSELVRRSRGFTYGGRAITALAAIVRGAPETEQEFAAAPPLRADLPIVVLSASDPRIFDGNLFGLRERSAITKDDRLRGHKEFAGVSSRGSWKIVPNSEHLIAVSNPDVVIETIFAMLDQIRLDEIR